MRGWLIGGVVHELRMYIKLRSRLKLIELLLELGGKISKRKLRLRRK